MLGILWKDLKVMRMQTAILTSIFLMMTVASVLNTGRQDDISFFLNFSTLMPIFFTLRPVLPWHWSSRSKPTLG